MRRRTRAAGLTVVALSTALTLTACGEDASSGASRGGASATPSTQAQQNDADVTYVSGMIPHHGQAIEMADLALTQATNPKVKALASVIKAAQDPEIRTMSGWLEAWKMPVPSATGDNAQMGHDTSMGSDTSTMMSPEQMSQLMATHGPAFDRMWTDMMIRHHEGAVQTSKAVLADGADPQVAKLAQQVIDAQTKEIATMRALLPQLTG